MASPSFKLHGYTDFALTAPEEKPNRKGLDAVRQSWQASRKDAFTVDDGTGGRLSRFPGYSAMFVDKADNREEIPGMAYEFSLEGLGLLDGRDKRIGEPVSMPEESWDTGTQTVFTRKPHLYVKQQPHPAYPSLYITEIEKDREIGDIFRLELSFKGIVKIDGQIKAYKRKITMGNRVISPAEAFPLNVKTGPGTYTTVTAKYSLDRSRLMVVDTFLSEDEPPTDMIPGGWTPPFPPTRMATADAPYLEGSSGWHTNIPSGWALKGIESEPLFLGTGPYLTTLTMEFVQPTEPIYETQSA
jgi:hypothetical protein